MTDNAPQVPTASEESDLFSADQDHANDSDSLSFHYAPDFNPFPFMDFSSSSDANTEHDPIGFSTSTSSDSDAWDMGSVNFFDPCAPHDDGMGFLFNDPHSSGGSINTRETELPTLSLPPSSPGSPPTTTLPPIEHLNADIDERNIVTSSRFRNPSKRVLENMDVAIPQASFGESESESVAGGQADLMDLDRAPLARPSPHPHPHAPSPSVTQSTCSMQQVLVSSSSTIGWGAHARSLGEGVGVGVDDDGECTHAHDPLPSLLPRHHPRPAPAPTPAFARNEFSFSSTIGWGALARSLAGGGVDVDVWRGGIGATTVMVQLSVCPELTTRNLKRSCGGGRAGARSMKDGRTVRAEREWASESTGCAQTRSSGDRRSSTQPGLLAPCSLLPLFLTLVPVRCGVDEPRNEDEERQGAGRTENRDRSTGCGGCAGGVGGVGGVKDGPAPSPLLFPARASIHHRRLGLPPPASASPRSSLSRVPRSSPCPPMSLPPPCSPPRFAPPTSRPTPAAHSPPPPHLRSFVPPPIITAPASRHAFCARTTLPRHPLPHRLRLPLSLSLLHLVPTPLLIPSLPRLVPPPSSPVPPHLAS
ncbi:hypothetical protein B0H13DRAFT_2491845 [Mycena leptocephala]|nr:hypothetical protein B0H13DRAFT_2491845 [Mycena leptocephala]